MLVFNLRHMHTLAWKTNVVVFSIIYSRVSWWAFSLQKQMCIEQRYACYLYRKCKSKHLEGAVRLYSRAVKTLKCHFFPPAPQIISVYLFLSSKGEQQPSTLDDATNQLFYTLPTCTHTHAPPPPPSTFQFQSSACVILFYLATPPPLVPSGVHFSSVDPTIPQPRTWAAHTSASSSTILMDFRRKSLCWHT